MGLMMVGQRMDRGHGKMVTAPVSTARYTAEDLWRWPEDGLRHELVRGEVVSMTPPGGAHGGIAVMLAEGLNAHVRAHRLGRVMVETGYILFRDPDTVRAPDVSFLAAARIPGGRLPERFIEGAPDLAVEVVSPGDTHSEVQERVQDYLRAGSRQVWVVEPRTRSLTVYAPDGTARILGEADTLAAEELLPGFALPLRELFA